MTGHDVEAAAAAVLSAPRDATVVLLMAVATRAAIAGRLLDAGVAPSTPVAVFERGATPVERRIRTTLGRLGRLAVASPAVLVVGAVAARLGAEEAGDEVVGPVAPSPGRPIAAIA